VARQLLALRLGPDGIAGLSLAAFVIPESLAYASLAGLPPVSGLYCYLAAGLAYAVFGTSRQLAVIDMTALASLRAFAVAMKRRGIAVRLAELRDDVADFLRLRAAEGDLGPIVAHRTVDQWVAASTDRAA
jgi:sulfate permease, SulP family